MAAYIDKVFFCMLFRNKQYMYGNAYWVDIIHSISYKINSY